MKTLTKMLPLICTMLVLGLGFTSASAQTITEIIDITGDGAGNPLDNPRGIAVDGSGNVYVAGEISDNVFKIAPGGVITEIIDPTGDGAGNTLNRPDVFSVAVDGSGNVYVTGLISDNAFKITPGGVITEIIDITGDGAGNPLDNCAGVAVDGSGNVYVAGQISDNAFKITPGGIITEIIDATGDGAGNPLDYPVGIAVDGSGNVYVAGQLSNNVFKITPGGVVTEIIDATGDGSGNTLVKPTGITVDGSGNVYVAGQISDNAFKITPGGVITEIIDATGDGAGNAFDFGSDIEVDGSGNVYVAGFFSANVFEITPGGVVTEIIDATGDGAGNTLNAPIGIAADGSGNVYVTGLGTDNAFKIALGSSNQPPDCSGATIADQNADANCGATISAADVTGVTDPDNDPLTITVSPTALVLGANTVTVTADDGNGGMCSTNITVNVIDDTPPTISCPADMVVDTAPGATGKVVNFNVSAGDNCSVTVTSSPASGSVFPLGTTTVTSTATDASGNTATCSFQVTVRPPLPHAYTLLADRDIFIKELVAADGNMHANNDIRFSDGAPASVNGNLTAVDDIEIQDDNTINGDVTAGDRVELHDETVVNGTVTANANVATVSIPSLSFSAGGNNVTVPQNGSMNLAPGSYGKVKVQKGGTLLLNHTGSTGDYFFDKLELDKNATLSFDANNGPIAVNVVDKLSFGEETEVTISSPLGSNSRFITFNSRDKVKVGKGARILGTINAPDDKVKLDKGVSFRGAICAGKIEIDKGGTYLHHDSGAILPKVATSAVTSAPGEEAEKHLSVENAATPTDFALEQNYPNPFNPSTTIRFSLPEAASVTLAIYNSRGQLVRTLVDGQMAPGSHSLVWNATDDHGARVASGLYLYTLKAGAVTLQRKLVLMK